MEHPGCGVKDKRKECQPSSFSLGMNQRTSAS